MKNKCLAAFLALIVFLFSPVITLGGPPPGAPGYAEANKSALASRSGLQLAMGPYSPSLSTLRNDLLATGWKPLSGGTYINLTILMNERNFSSSGGIGFGYWSGSTSKESGESLSLSLFMFNVSPAWNIMIIRDRLALGLGFVIRPGIASLNYNSPSSQYYKAITMAMDLGPSIGIELYPLSGSRALSISAGVEDILYGFVFGAPEVYDSNIPGYGSTTKIITNSGKDMAIETNGLIIKWGINLRFGNPGE